MNADRGDATPAAPQPTLPVAEDPHDLQRFVVAQNPVFDTVLAELAAGAKRSHWMWFVFPQLRGLGRSAMAQHYGIASLEEARAYWRHALLGPRLRQCCTRLAALQGRSAEAIFGPVDAMKLRSCLTLFEQAAPADALFGDLLRHCFAGRRDDATLARLAAERGGAGA